MVLRLRAALSTSAGNYPAANAAGPQLTSVKGVVEMFTRFFRLHPASTLHRYVGDDLETVGNPALDFLQEYRLADQVVLDARFRARIGYIRHGDQKADVLEIAIIERAH
jgi:hypothetical protein